MNLAIITLEGNFNYGNRLQNYALQKILMESCQANVDNLTFSDKFLYKKYKSERPFWAKVKSKIFDFKKIQSRKKQIKIKNRVFRPFRERNFNFVDVRIDNVSEIVGKYNYFVIGSDQVWNPLYKSGDEAMFATFAPSEKVISYAASFGISKIPEKFYSYIEDGLKHVSKISVREQEGVTIVKSLSNKNAQLVLDPTMLLTGKDWHEIIKDTEISFVNSKAYVVIYVLGKLTDNKKNLVQKFIKKHKFEVHIIMGEQATSDAVVPDPLGFVKLIENAEFVFTDSFHATVFSIIMRTPFKVFSRDGGEMNSRIVTLLQNTGLSPKLIYDDNIEKLFNELSFNNVEEKLLELRSKSLLFLKEAIE